MPREAFGQRVEVVDQPGVGEQALGDLAGRRPRPRPGRAARRAPSTGGSGAAPSLAVAADQRPRRRPRLPASRSTALVDRADDGGPQPLAERRRDGPLESRAGLDQARQHIVAALDGSARRASPRRPASSPSERGPALGCLLASARARSCIWVAWRSARARLLRGERSVAPARPWPPPGAARPPRPPDASRAPSSESPAPSFASSASSSAIRAAPAPSSGSVVELVEAQLALAQRRAQVALGELQGLGTGADALDRRARLGQQLAVSAPPLLPGRDPLLDRGAALADLLEALLDRVAARAHLGQPRSPRPPAAPAGRGGRRRRSAPAARSPAQQLRRALGRLGLPLQRPQRVSGPPVRRRAPARGCRGCARA